MLTTHNINANFYKNVTEQTFWGFLLDYVHLSPRFGTCLHIAVKSDFPNILSANDSALR